MPDTPDFAQLRELAEKATPRPWYPAIHEESTVKKLMAWLSKFGMHYPDNKIIHMVGSGKIGDDGLDEDEIRVPAVTGNGPCSEANRDYIVAAANGLPVLMDEYERLRAVINRAYDLAIENGIDDPWHQLGRISEALRNGLKGGQK